MAVCKLLKTSDLFSMRAVAELSQELSAYPVPCGNSLLKKAWIN